MPAMTPVSSDDPLKIAWDAYCKTDEAKNSKRWAQKLDIEQDTSGAATLTHRHLDGLLWAAFMAGFAAGKALNE